MGQDGVLGSELVPAKSGQSDSGYIPKVKLARLDNGSEVGFEEGVKGDD